nr:hypothetical protein [uncultured Flavobacterium sp.]
MEHTDIQKELNALDIVLKVISDDQIHEIADLLTVSMLNNNAYSYVFNSKKTRATKLKLLLTCMVRLYSRHNGTFAIYHNSKIVGTFTFLPSSYLRPNLIDLIKSRIIFIPFLIDFGELKRLLKISKINITFLKKIEPHLSFWHCCMLAVKLEGQQFRIGKKSIEIFLQQNDISNKCIVLTTQGDKNIKFFSQFGFSIKHKYVINNFENIIMQKNELI